MNKKLLIITTHPIQYYAPIFSLLSAKKGIEIKVLYTWGEQSLHKFDPGFGKTIDWDIPLLNGYAYEFLKNTSKEPGSHHRNGIINPGIIKKVTDFAPDAILIYGWAYQSHLKVLRTFKGKIPIWFRGDSTLLDETKGLKGMLKNLFLHWVYRHVDLAFYVGGNNKNYFKKYGLREEQLIFAPHAIDNSRFEVSHESAAFDLRKKLNIKDEEILILFAGKLEPKKDPGLLIDAFMAIKKDGVHLLIVGNGVLEESLKSKVLQATKNKDQRLKTKAQRIHFMDFQNQSQMPGIYQACNLFCLPSKGPSETWGLAINEAMAASRAILTSNKVGAAINLIQEGQNGMIFKAGDLEDVIEKMTSLVQDQIKLQEMGVKSKAIINNWNFETQVETIAKELASL